MNSKDKDKRIPVLLQGPYWIIQKPFQPGPQETFLIELKVGGDQPEGDRASHTLPAVDPILHEDGG